MTRSTIRTTIWLAALLLAMAMLIPTTAASAAGEDPSLSADRYGTAARAALSAFPDGADIAVLASGETFPDALAAAPLAEAYDAPVLLTARESLPQASADTLAALGVADVLVMGGASAVGNDVTNALHVDYQVSRVAGADRYETAARAAVDAFPDGAQAAVVATGETFPDALAAAPLARAYDAPILLTAGGQLPSITGDTLALLGVDEILLMGGEGAVSTDVSNALFDHGHVTRVAGADRYETAARAAEEAFPGGANVAVLASGEAFPDSLAAAPLAAFHDAPVLLTGADATPASTLGELTRLGVGDVLVMGGADAIGNAVTNALHIDYQVTRVAGG